MTAEPIEDPALGDPLPIFSAAQATAYRMSTTQEAAKEFSTTPRTLRAWLADAGHGPVGVTEKVYGGGARRDLYLSAHILDAVDRTEHSPRRRRSAPPRVIGVPSGTPKGHYVWRDPSRWRDPRATK